MKHAMATFAFVFIWIAAAILLCLPIALILINLMPTKFAIQFGSNANCDNLGITAGLLSAIIGVFAGYSLGTGNYSHGQRKNAERRRPSNCVNTKTEYQASREQRAMIDDRRNHCSGDEPHPWLGVCTNSRTAECRISNRRIMKENPLLWRGGRRPGWVTLNPNDY